MANLKFLVVEDDLFYQTYVNDILAETGVDIVNASDGEAGLALALSELPDLIITDIEIPKIQGFVFFKTLRERPETKHIPVIMMSGKVEKALLDRHSDLSIHADGYLVKPFSGQVLIDMIRDIVGDDFGFSEVVISQENEVEVESGKSEEDKSEPEIKLHPEKDPAEEQTEGRLTVLVVDDSKYICDISHDFLEELGIRVKTAADGEAGYQMACDLLPDLILLDVQMPNMNGFVVCEMLRKKEATKDIPIILMSAVVDDDSFQRHSKLRYHADAYLQKPFKKSELHDLVRQFTSPGERSTEGIESKTGFFVPSEDPDGSADESGMVTSADPGLVAELEKTKTELQEAAGRGLQLEAAVESVRKEKDELEAELYELRKTVEGKEGSIQDKLTLATQKVEEIRAENEKLTRENLGLQTKLKDTSHKAEESEKISLLEEELRQANESLGEKVSENQELLKKIEEKGTDLELKAQISELSIELQEASAAALELENRNRLLEEEAEKLRGQKEAADPSGGISPEPQKLLEEIQSLKRDLNAAQEAKKEIEDQAKSLLESGIGAEKSDDLTTDLEKARRENMELEARIKEGEDQAHEINELQAQLDKQRTESEKLRQRLEEANSGSSTELSNLKVKLSNVLERAQKIEEEKENLERSVRELRETAPGGEDFDKQIGELREELEKSRTLAAEETQARMDLQGQLSDREQEISLLTSELEETRKRIEEKEGAAGRVTELENMLEDEKKQRTDVQIELEKFRSQLVELEQDQENAKQLERANTQLESDLEAARKRCETLEKEAHENIGRSAGDITPDAGKTAQWDERLAQFEETLDKTVLEAQKVLKEQKDREFLLEENIESLVKSLEEERTAFRKEREDWRIREGELQNSFEDALRESRRLMGEEAARLYPMHVPLRSRPLEVVTWKSKYSLAAVFVLAGLLLFAGGYLLSSKGTSQPVQFSTGAVENQEVGPVRQVASSKPPEPWIIRSAPEETYEELWRRNTIQSISDDMMIQATLHTRDELEAAINYTASKEGWTQERISKAMSDMAKTYNLSGSYYITVYSKNLKSGYPGYADSFENHIALRDHSGREVRAHFPGELEGSRFITSRVSAAGKEMNPVFLYEVGLTVAFARKGLADRPQGLQLVLYDIGAVPMRVLTWDMSELGSFSQQDFGEGKATG